MKSPPTLKLRRAAFARADRVGGFPDNDIPFKLACQPKPWRRLAERVGFEPTVPLPAHVLSRHADSATLAPLQNFRTFKYAILCLIALRKESSIN